MNLCQRVLIDTIPFVQYDSREPYNGSLPHPAGQISAEFIRQGERLTGQMTLPEDVSGVPCANGQEICLSLGTNTVLS